MNALTERLGITLPVIQAPMAGISTPELAAAVSNAGALGSIGVGAMDAEAARVSIRATRALTSRPFNVNLFCHAPAQSDPARDADWLTWLAPLFARFGATPPTALTEIYTSFVEDDAMLAMLVEERPAVVSFHFGLPSAERFEVLRRAGILLLASATNLAEARQIAKAGVDAIVAQGIEAGGHRGVFDPEAEDPALSTFALTRLLVKETSLPVIAAGGIMDGAGIAAALSLGAQAAQMGTAFIACPESSADSEFRKALLGPMAEHTVFTSAISGRVARGFANAFTSLGNEADRPPIPQYPVAYDAGKALHAAAKAKGNFDYAAWWAGQGAPLSRALPAADLVAQLHREYRETLEAVREP